MCPKPCGSAFPSWYLKASSFSTGHLSAANIGHGKRRWGKRWCTSAIIPGQFEQALSVRDGIDAIGRLLRHASEARVAEKVQVEAVVGVLDPAHERHAHDVAVEAQRPLGRLHPQHRVVLHMPYLVISPALLLAVVATRTRERGRGRGRTKR